MLLSRFEVNVVTRVTLMDVVLMDVVLMSPDAV
jgi:hypothetical protein